jgi:hypothetical protein
VQSDVVKLNSCLAVWYENVASIATHCRSLLFPSLALQSVHCTGSLSLSLQFQKFVILHIHFLLPTVNGKALVNSYNYQKRVGELPNTFARSPSRSRTYGNGTTRKSISRRKGIINISLEQDDQHTRLKLKKKILAGHKFWS